ncbi:uncharacterized protein [Amphiura filiformis]|uniref:uncharacterized protein n=1 Tax=Amphiura filiformis TaxID=82378 RepID=UPI003B2122A4
MENVSTCRCVLFVLISLQLLLTFTSHVVNAECYVGSINSTTSGKVAVISVLHVEACGPTPLPSTEAPSTTNAATNATTTMAPTNATTAAVITNATTAAANTTTAPLTTTAKPTPTTKPNTTDEIVTTPTPPEDPNQRFRRDLETPTTPPPPPPTSCAYFKYFSDPVLKENGTWTANFHAL